MVTNALWFRVHFRRSFINRVIVQNRQKSITAIRTYTMNGMRRFSIRNILYFTRDRVILSQSIVNREYLGQAAWTFENLDAMRPRDFFEISIQVYRSSETVWFDLNLTKGQFTAFVAFIQREFRSKSVVINIKNDIAENENSNKIVTLQCETFHNFSLEIISFSSNQRCKVERINKHVNQLFIHL